MSRNIAENKHNRKISLAILAANEKYYNNNIIIDSKNIDSNTNQKIEKMIVRKDFISRSYIKKSNENFPKIIDIYARKFKKKSIDLLRQTQNTIYDNKKIDNHNYNKIINNVLNDKTNSEKLIINVNSQKNHSLNLKNFDVDINAMNKKEKKKRNNNKPSRFNSCDLDSNNKLDLSKNSDNLNKSLKSAIENNIFNSEKIDNSIIKSVKKKPKRLKIRTRSSIFSNYKKIKSRKIEKLDNKDFNYNNEENTPYVLTNQSFYKDIKPVNNQNKNNSQNVKLKNKFIFKEKLNTSNDYNNGSFSKNKKENHFSTNNDVNEETNPSLENVVFINPCLNFGLINSSKNKNSFNENKNSKNNISNQFNMSFYPTKGFNQSGYKTIYPNIYQNSISKKNTILLKDININKNTFNNSTYYWSNKNFLSEDFSTLEKTKNKLSSLYDNDFNHKKISLEKSPLNENEENKISYLNTLSPKLTLKNKTFYNSNYKNRFNSNQFNHKLKNIKIDIFNKYDNEIKLNKDINFSPKDSDIIQNKSPDDNIDKKNEFAFRNTNSIFPSVFEKNRYRDFHIFNNKLNVLSENNLATESYMASYTDKRNKNNENRYSNIPINKIKTLEKILDIQTGTLPDININKKIEKKIFFSNSKETFYPKINENDNNKYFENFIINSMDNNAIKLNQSSYLKTTNDKFYKNEKSNKLKSNKNYINYQFYNDTITSTNHQTTQVDWNENFALKNLIDFNKKTKPNENNININNFIKDNQKKKNNQESPKNKITNLKNSKERYINQIKNNANFTLKINITLDQIKIVKNKIINFIQTNIDRLISDEYITDKFKSFDFKLKCKYDFSLAKEFLFYYFLNYKANYKLSLKKIGRNEINNVDENNNKIKSKINSFAFEFFFSENKKFQKDMQDINYFVNIIIDRIEKEINVFLSFLNRINHTQVFKMEIDNFFVNFYTIKSDNIFIDNKILSILIDFISNAKEKKFSFENYFQLKKIPKEEIKDFTTQIFFNHFFFLKNFLKAVLEISIDLISNMKLTLHISDKELTTILYSEDTKIDKLCKDMNFRLRISGIYFTLVKALI